MSKVRYKIRREQLERVVEHFVMESAMIEKNAAKKHTMSMGAEQSDDMGDGMKKAPVAKKHKMKQAPEVKKNIHGRVNESKDETEFFGDLMSAMEESNIEMGELNEGLFGSIGNKIKNNLGIVSTVLFSTGLAQLVNIAVTQEQLAEKGISMDTINSISSNPLQLIPILIGILGVAGFIKWISDAYKKMGRADKINSLKRYLNKYPNDEKRKAELDELLKS